MQVREWPGQHFKSEWSNKRQSTASEPDWKVCKMRGGDLRNLMAGQTFHSGVRECIYRVTKGLKSSFCYEVKYHSQKNVQ